MTPVVHTPAAEPAQSASAPQAVPRASLRVPQPSDPFVQEADRVADRVTQMTSGKTMRTCGCDDNTMPLRPSASASGGNLVSRSPSAQAGSGHGSKELAPEIAKDIAVARGGGRNLDHRTRCTMEGHLGFDLSKVRIHDGNEADRLSRSVEATAFTTGSDVFFRTGLFSPGTNAGRQLLSHELTHVIQQSTGRVGNEAGIGAVDSPDEREAVAAARSVSESDHSSSHALARSPEPHVQRVSQTPSSTHIQRFEAPLHEAAEMQGLIGPGGLTLEEANAAYFGNWMRDVNQAFVPALAAWGMPPDAVFAALSYMAATKFGRTLSPQQLGYYIAAEHLDNPAGLLPTDLEITDQFARHPVTTGGPANPVVNPNVPAALSDQQDTDPRRATIGGLGILQVDQSGVMGFIHRSVQLVEQRIQLAVSRGRNPDGLAHLGAGLHTVEDLFAHSNWVEIAVQQSLRMNFIGVTNRDVFNYAPDLGVGAPRPVLTTGTFSGIDTQISIGSELVTMFRRPLPEPATSAQSEEAERFTAAMLDAFSGRLAADPDLRQRIGERLRTRGVPGPLVDAMLGVGSRLGDLYRWTRIPLPGLPFAEERARVGALLRAKLSELVLRPLADRIAGELLDARAADTPQLNVLSASRATIADHQRSTSDQRGAADETATPAPIQTAERRAIQLGLTPASAVAGPSHSQLAKDHTNSPFFGLAFALATEAVRRIRVQVVRAWGTTSEFDFDHGEFPEALSAGASREDHAERSHQSALFHEGRSQRNRQLSETDVRGQRILNDGGEGDAYNLAATRRADAAQIRETAAALTTIAQSPQWAEGFLADLSSWIGQIGDARLERARVALRHAGHLAANIDSDARIRAVEEAGNALRLVADQVEAARTRAQRATARQEMDRSYAEVLSALGVMPTGLELRSIILSAIDRQRSLLDPAYSPRQRALLERIDTTGRLQGQAPAGLESAPPLQQGRYQGPTPNRAAADAIAEVRMVMGHPHDSASTWWHATVNNYVERHLDRLLVDIEARNEGIGFLRRPGDSSHAGHQH